nr:MAG TPA: hypothetical protein [Caudoviricetes sp.]
MTYAQIILPYELKKTDVNSDPKTKQSLKGKLTSALKNAPNTIKSAIQNPGATFADLGKYMQTAENMACKFSAIGLAQLMADGKITNQAALDYLFLGFAPALDKQAVAMGYSGATQMKDALKNGSINVGSFVSGFSKVLKGGIDYANTQKSKQEQKQNNILEIDVVFNHNETYQSEAPDRRVENGMSFQEVLHNLAETYSIDCGLQDGRRYTKQEFKGYLTALRESKMVFDMVIGDENLSNVVLQNFTPAVNGAISGLDYTLELKKVHIGSVESTPITIGKAPQGVVESANVNSSGAGGVGSIKIPSIIPNAVKDELKGILSQMKDRSVLKIILE